MLLLGITWDIRLLKCNLSHLQLVELPRPVNYNKFITICFHLLMQNGCLHLSKMRSIFDKVEGYVVQSVYPTH